MFDTERKLPMNINIPEKQRQEFDRAANYAVEHQTFTPSELAVHLNTGVFVASIMVGYMEKASLVTKGKGDDVRRAKITPEEWDAIDRKIENYVPVPEPEPETFVAQPEDNTEIDITDIIPQKISFFKKTLLAEEGFITIEEKDISTAIATEDISTVFLHKGGFFRKGTLTLSSDSQIPVKAKLRADTVCFKKKDYSTVKELAEKLSERLGINLVEI